MDYEGKTLRQELKYTISEHEYILLRGRLHSLLHADAHAGPKGEYRISSLYFDNLTNDAWFEKDAGYQIRSKYRIRIYDGKESLIRLERKEKFGQSTAKTSRLISMELYKKILSGNLRFCQIQEDALLRHFYLRVALEALKPKVIVEYVREPFVCMAGNVRVTFDKKLTVVLNTLDLFADCQTRASPPDFADMILEVKYDDFLPVHIRNLLRLNHHQRLALSKYTICRELKNSFDWKELVL